MDFAPALIAKLEERAARFAEIEELILTPEVSGDHKRMADLMRERGRLEEASQLLAEYRDFETRLAEAKAFLEEGGDEEMKALYEEEQETIETALPGLDQRMKAALITDEDDDRTKIIIEIRAGTGGDEATLFARDLYKMYRTFFETQRWRVEDFDVSTSEVGGFKEVVFAVEGEGAWRRLRFESGGHRVQRVPSTETQGRIHTSAATVAVLPEAEDVDVEVRTEDLRVDTMRSSGPGGQSVNKTSSAVRMTHLPTGVVVTCQDEKSQHKNRAKALRVLKSRLFDLEQERIHSERAADRKSKVGSGDRSARVRTYNYPQNRVTDHRLGQNFSLEQVGAGKLESLLEALEAHDREQRIADL